jgi:ABC-type dipeptide/oligopeptide/nickel transport system ATPase subunit
MPEVLFSPNAPSSPLLSIRDLSNVYVSRSYGLFGKKEIKRVLKHVNMYLARGEIAGLTGESGCGKSTLARCVMGLVDYEGEIRIDGQAQMVFQESGASLNPAKKIGWLMEEPLVIHKRGTAAERTQKADEMLTRVGLDPSYKTRRVHELSGGQKQRVCIGRALILEPKLLIADEPISSLDVSAGAQILNLLKELRENPGLGILFISHNMDAVEYLCDRIMVMRDGRIAERQ